MKNGFRVIDADGHMQEPLDIWDNYIEKEYHGRRPLVSGHVARYLFNYHPCEAFPKGRVSPRPESVFADCPDRDGEAWETWWSLPARLVEIEKEGLDIQIGFHTNGTAALSPNIEDPNLQNALCRGYNNWARDYCSKSKGKVKFIGLVSIIDVNLAIAETERLSEIPECAAINLPDPGSSTNWADPQFNRFWETLSSLDLAASFHGGGSQTRWFRGYTETPGLASVSHAIAFPLDGMLSMGTLIFGNVLENFPKLRCSFLEGNAGWAPWWLARMDDHAIGRQSRFQYEKDVSMDPSNYFKRQCFIACDADEQTLPFVANELGDNLIFNTDWPHPDAPIPGAVDMFLDQDFSDETKRSILWDNSIRLYGDRILN